MTRLRLQLTKAEAADRPPDALLGPWCVTQAAPPRPALSDGATPRDFVEIAEDFPEVYRTVVEALTGILNETFGVARPPRYWAVVTHPLLYHYVVSFLVKSKVVANALGSRAAGYEAAYALPNGASAPLLYSDLRVAYEEDDRFNLEVFSRVCQSQGLPGVELGRPQWRPLDSSRRLRRIARALYAYSTEAKRSWARPSASALGEGAVLYKDMDRRFASDLAGTSGLRFVPLSEVARLRSRPRLAADAALRRRAPWGHPEPMVDGILQGLRFHLPVHHLETYPGLLCGARRLLDRTGAPEAVLFSILERPGYRVLAAEAMQMGARIVSIQHGGNYGESLFAVSEVVERSFSDRFVTFGWRKDPDKDVPAGGFRTMRLAPWPAPRGDGDVLLVAPQFQEYPHHANWSPATRQRERRTLLEELSPAVRRRLVVRMRPGRTASARLEREWLAPFPELRIDHGREPIDAAMRRSSLIVIGYVFSTTLLEAVKMDRPFLIFDQGFEELLTPAARPVYGLLREAGLVRSDPVETAAAIEEVLKDVEKWWAAPSRRAAVACYRQRFVKEADLAAWSGLLQELVAEGARP